MSPQASASLPLRQEALGVVMGGWGQGRRWRAAPPDSPW